MGKAPRNLRAVQAAQQKNLDKKQSNRIQVFASSLVKGAAGALLFIPITMIAFGWECFKRNEWPWSERL